MHPDGFGFDGQSQIIGQRDKLIDLHAFGRLDLVLSDDGADIDVAHFGIDAKFRQLVCENLAGGKNLRFDLLAVTFRKLHRTLQEVRDGRDDIFPVLIVVILGLGLGSSLLRLAFLVFQRRFFRQRRLKILSMIVDHRTDGSFPLAGGGKSFIIDGRRFYFAGFLLFLFGFTASRQIFPDSGKPISYPAISNHQQGAQRHGSQHHNRGTRHLEKPGEQLPQAQRQQTVHKGSLPGSQQHLDKEYKDQEQISPLPGQLGIRIQKVEKGHESHYYKGKE